MRYLLLILLIVPMISISAQTSEQHSFYPENGEDSMYYKESGQGDTVLLMIHGLGSNSEAFSKLQEISADHFKSVVIDLPGYRESPKGDLHPGMQNYAELLIEFIEGKKYQNVILVGHSMGGQIAMTMAQQSANMPWLKGLFLLAPAGLETFNEKDKAWFNTYVTAASMAALPDEQIRRNFDVNFATGKMPEDALFMYRERIEMKKDAKSYMEYLETVTANVNAMLEEPVHSKIPEIEVPVWVVYGKQDYLIPNRILHPGLSIEDLKAQCNFTNPESKFLTIDNAGHFLVWEQPEEIVKLLREFPE